MNAIYILWLRQLKRTWRARSRIIGALANPILFLIAFGFGFGPIFEKAGGGDYIQFLAPGIISQSILFTSIFTGIEIIHDKQFGFLKEIMVAPVSRIYIMLGRTFGGATIAAIQGLIVLLLTFVVGFRLESWFNIIPAIIVMLLVATMFAGIGTAIASIMEDMQGFQLIMNFFILPTFFLSGALFPVDNFPVPIKIVSYVNPLSYGVDALRYFLEGGSHFGIGLDMIVLVMISTITVSIGAYLFRKIQIK